MNDSRQKKVVYAAGVFDLLHVGHIKYLKAAKELGDILVVGLVDDEGVEHYKFKKPTISYDQRFEIINAIKYVDMVVRQDDTDPTRTLKELEKTGIVPHIMVRGTDYKDRPPGTKFIEDHYGTVVRIPYTDGISDTVIKDQIINEYGGYL